MGSCTILFTHQLAFLFRATDCGQRMLQNGLIDRNTRIVGGEGTDAILGSPL